VVVLVTVVVVVACVVLHYDIELADRLDEAHHPAAAPAYSGADLRHPVVPCHGDLDLGAGYYYLISVKVLVLLASHAIGLLDCIYSAVCFTTLGLGDVVPTGAVRHGHGSADQFVLLTGLRHSPLSKCNASGAHDLAVCRCLLVALLSACTSLQPACGFNLGCMQAVRAQLSDDRADKRLHCLASAQIARQCSVSEAYGWNGQRTARCSVPAIRVG
jgi:hypothetical protein